MLRRLLVGWKVSLARLAKWRRWMAAGMGQLAVRVFQTFLKKVEDFVRCSCSKDVPCCRSMGAEKSGTACMWLQHHTPSPTPAGQPGLWSSMAMPLFQMHTSHSPHTHPRHG